MDKLGLSDDGARMAPAEFSQCALTILPEKAATVSAEMGAAYELVKRGRAQEFVFVGEFVAWLARRAVPGANDLLGTRGNVQT